MLLFARENKKLLKEGLFTCRVKSRGSGRVGSGRVESGGLQNLAGRVGSGQEVLKSRGSGRVGSGGFQNRGSGRIGSGQDASKFSRVGSGRVKTSRNSHGSGRVSRPDPTRLDPRDLTRPVKSPAKNQAKNDLGTFFFLFLFHTHIYCNKNWTRLTRSGDSHSRDCCMLASCPNSVLTTPVLQVLRSDEINECLFWLRELVKKYD